MDRHCRQAWQEASYPSGTSGTLRRTSAGLSAGARPPAASSWYVPNTFRPAKVCAISHVWVMFFRVPALKEFRAAHRPLKWWQTVDCRLPVRSLSAADLCGHRTDRKKRTDDYHEYTHHRVRGLKFLMGTTEITHRPLRFGC